MNHRLGFALGTTSSCLLLLASAGCDGSGDGDFDLGAGEFAWSHVTVSVFMAAEPLTEWTDAPPSEWRAEGTPSECELWTIVYGIGSSAPCEGRFIVHIDDCAADPSLGSWQRCRVTLGTLELALRPDYEAPVIDGAVVELSAPVSTEETWLSGTLIGALSLPSGTLTITGRDGGARTLYEVSLLDVTIEQINGYSALRLEARKPGW